ncbi:stage II sporulation protein P [Clostridium lacusfryxellense]|uniref:stage II sporulation protein P n=1 Tax=Clostridium lacusfryxellense TaxID=205328 RepID=UPI001C0D2BC7|nr:stage II sporulation protein P [Clostridium lacusfryxellense]MBU3110457.1 stage II sporulation protein P [Clostridium lacusfryxellense]
MNYKIKSCKVINFIGEYKNRPSKKTNFSKYNIRKKSNVRIFFSVFALLIIFLIGIILPISAKANSEGEYRNYFYVNVINNALSVIKISNNKEQSTNSEDSMKLAALSFIGVDLMNPISIVVKEIAYLDKNDNNTQEDDSKVFSLNPFKLGDNQISKTDSKSDDSNLVATLDNPALKTALNNAKPRVLIYHSHTCEAYALSGNDLAKTKSSTDQTRNVCIVGDVIKSELESKYGIAVIHDKTVHDKGDYNNAYKKSGVTLDKYLKVYEKFDLIIDLHRDSVENKNSVTTKINGENVAKFMFVVTDKNPKYGQQKKLINSLVAKSNKLYPGLAKSNPIYAYHWGMGFYNQNRSDNALLIEVGTYTNTVQEVKNTGKYLSRVIAEQLNGKK